MEMKINFTKLFNFQDTASESKQSSFHYDEPSGDYSYLADQFKYQNNRQIFISGNQYHSTNILQDFSTINRSLQRSLDKSIEKSQQNKSYTSHLKSQTGKSKVPGERLYYQSQMDQLRKQKQLQRLKVQMIAQQNKEITFKPVINQRSKKIAEKHIQSPKRQKKIETMSYVAQKQEQQLKNCTFKPILIAKDKTGFNRTSNQRSKTEVFQHLYNDHKVKQMKMKINMQAQQYQQKKKLTKTQLQDFFQRNQDYIEKQNKKQQMVKHVSHNYDLTSGRKLFSPKIQKQAGLFKSTTSRGNNSTTLNNANKVNLFNKMKSQDDKGGLNYLSMESKKLFTKLQFQRDQMDEHGGFQQRPTSEKPIKSIHDSVNKSQIIQQVEEQDHIINFNQQPMNLRQPQQSNLCQKSKPYYNKEQNQISRYQQGNDQQFKQQIAQISQIQTKNLQESESNHQQQDAQWQNTNIQQQNINIQQQNMNIQQQHMNIQNQEQEIKISDFLKMSNQNSLCQRECQNQIQNHQENTE